MQFLLKFLLIALLVIWLLRLAARLLFPWAMRKAAEKIMRDAGQPFQGNPFDGQGPRAHTYTYQWGRTYTQDNKQGPAGSGSAAGKGEVRIDYVPPKTQAGRGKSEAGEFVDFVEVSEKD